MEITIGKFFSKKMKQKTCFFSNLEYHNFLTLEMNPKVVQMCEQPLEIEVMIDGKLKKSILDFWIKYDDGSEEIQEVKSVESLTEGSKDYIRTRLTTLYHFSFMVDYLVIYINTL